MLRVKDITKALLNVVGWDPETGYGDGITIDSDLTTSESGLYFQQAHALITLRNMTAIAPDFQNSDNKQAAFSTWLRAKTEASIAKAITTFCDSKLANKINKTLLENKVLFDGTVRISDTVDNTGSFVGFELVTLRAKGVTTKINKIGLQFTEPGLYKLYLFHSSRYEPIKTFTFEKKEANSLEWFVPDEPILLPYMSDDTDAGGSWYLGYIQTELPLNSKAIFKRYDWSKGPCVACSRRELELFKAWSRFLEVHPFKVKPVYVSGDYNFDFSRDFKIGDAMLWDVSTNLYTYDTNYGINLDISVYCDISDIIIEQRNMFRSVIQLQLAADMLRELAYNPNVRVNRAVLNASRAELLYELDGDSRAFRRSGITYRLEEAYKAIDFNTRGIDRICLPCKNGGIRYKSI